MKIIFWIFRARISESWQQVCGQFIVLFRFYGRNFLQCLKTILLVEIQRGIPAVVLMQYEITDCAALEFSRTFYDALADGIPIDASVTEARKAISIALDDSIEWSTPVLHMRSPLMLNLMVRAYQDLTVEDLAREGLESGAARRKHLFDTYIARVFRRAGQGSGHA